MISRSLELPPTGNVQSTIEALVGRGEVNRIVTPTIYTAEDDVVLLVNTSRPGVMQIPDNLFRHFDETPGRNNGFPARRLGTPNIRKEFTVAEEVLDYDEIYYLGPIKRGEGEGCFIVPLLVEFDCESDDSHLRPKNPKSSHRWTDLDEIEKLIRDPDGKLTESSAAVLDFYLKHDTEI